MLSYPAALPHRMRAGGDKMRIRIKVTLFYAALLLLGFCAGIFIRCRYGISIAFTLFCGTEKREAAGFLILYYHAIRLSLLIFLSGFTVFAPFVSGVVILYGGAMFGCLSLRWTSAILATPQGVGMLLLSTGIILLHLYLSSEAALHRSGLRTLAPTAKMFLRSPATRRYICAFLFTATMLLAAAALYWFTDWFSGIL